jgi:hypothetical protein
MSRIKEATNSKSQIATKIQIFSRILSTKIGINMPTILYLCRFNTLAWLSRMQKMHLAFIVFYIVALMKQRVIWKSFRKVQLGFNSPKNKATPWKST